MKPAGRIALAAATATTLVSGTAAAFAAAHPDTEQVAEVQADPHAQLKAALSHRLDRLDARATELEHRIRLAGHDLGAARRSLLAARAEAARQAAAAAAVATSTDPSPEPQATSTTTTPTPVPVVTPPEPHTSTGASGSTGGGDDDNGTENDGGIDD